MEDAPLEVVYHVDLLLKAYLVLLPSYTVYCVFMDIVISPYHASLL